MEESQSELVVNPKQIIKKEGAHLPAKSDRKLFINYLDNPITIFFMSKDNQKHTYIIPAGVTRSIDCIVQRIKTVTYFDRYQRKTVAIPLAKLQENAVIVFTLDNKVEYFNFINIRQKHEKINEIKVMLRKARLVIPYNLPLIEKLETKIEDLYEQTIYQQ